MAWTFHLFEAIKANIDRIPIHEQHGESVGNSFAATEPGFRDIFSRFNFTA